MFVKNGPNLIRFERSTRTYFVIRYSLFRSDTPIVLYCIVLYFTLLYYKLLLLLLIIILVVEYCVVAFEFASCTATVRD